MYCGFQVKLAEVGGGFKVALVICSRWWEDVVEVSVQVMKLRCNLIDVRSKGKLK